MTLLFRALIGFGLAAAGLTCLAYGVAQAIEIGTCGTNRYGLSIGPPCPSGLAPMIVLMIFGTFAAVAGAAIAGRLLRFIPVIVIAAGAGVALGAIDLHDDDSRPGLEVIPAVVAPMLLLSLPGYGKRRQRPNLLEAMAKMQQQRQTAEPQPAPASTAATADGIAARLRQLEQLKESGLLDDAAYEEQRRRILSEL